MPIELKIKQKSLAAESRIIRKEELKQRNYGRFMLRTQQPSEMPYGMYLSLRNHRMELRGVSRATGLARAYLKGQDYAKVEQPKRGGYIDVPMIIRMVNKYPSDPLADEVTGTMIRNWIEV